MIRVGINGFGRIGRAIVRALYESGYRETIQVVAVNDLAPVEINARLLQYDSVHGRFSHGVSWTEDALQVGDDRIACLAIREPEQIPWGKLGVELVMECTGKFRTGDTAGLHIMGGASKVLVSAPARDVDATVVFGVNEGSLEPEHRVVSNASCTTNCLAPIMRVLHEYFGVEAGTVTTIHAMTNDQNLLDKAHKDIYRARSAVASMIPTRTGAAAAIGEVLPGVAGTLHGMAVRVPTTDVSMVDIVVQVARDTDRDEVNAALQNASARMPVLAYSEEPLVSVDYVHHPASAIVDGNQTHVQGRLVKVMAWYDNEWGFSNRMLDTALTMMSL
ncbi:MAG: type I glyceraldehyde-3-phosphate dehydrogenase [Gammaproteobacteria bacterium]|nr:MAG: type I glyceraldehyde-3-phosphate dehydrogenase [Gammaproteobacteria bacterium]